MTSQKKIAVIGLGRVGLPLALFFARKDFLVYGIDKNPNLIKAYQMGKMPFLIGGQEGFLKSILWKSFFPTTNYDVVKNVSYIVLTVGGYKKNYSDTSSLLNAINSILPFLKANQCMIIRTTVEPGTTKKIAQLIQDKTSFHIGKNFFLAYCPERSLEGKIFEELNKLPQIIGAEDSASRKKAAVLFNRITKKLLFSNSICAELAKIFSNFYRYANFAIANECMMATQKLGENVYEVIRLVNTDYIRGGIALPGFAGGPCLPKSSLLIPDIHIYPTIAKAAYKINENLPDFLIKK
jgi:UDP-N-acetyl-D-mannosaminuronic acid dehydrogenase